MPFPAKFSRGPGGLCGIWRNREREREKVRKKGLGGGVILILLLLLMAALLYGTARVVAHLKEEYLQMTMDGDREITLEYGTDFVDPGASAVYWEALLKTERVDVEVAIGGSVDTGKVGTYQLCYQASYGGHEVTDYRQVHVVDTQAPVITLVADPEAYTLPGHEYEEEGFSAADGYDGDITERVTRTEEDGIITYTVTDSSGNSAAVQRQIVYKDPIPPTLDLLGEKSMTLNAGTPFEEPGYAAEDNCDGDLTSKVEVTGAVDIYLSGTYTLTYSVSDAYGNAVSAQRTVTIKAVPQPEVVVPQGKVIYLTFDDGPSYYTPRLLQILKKYNVKATFFVVKTGYFNYITDIVKAGHSIGIHSVTHDFSQIYASEEAYFNDLLTMQDLIYQKTGVKTTLMRFPGGSSNTVSSFNPGIMTKLTRAVQDMGFQYFDWNVSSGDAGNTTSTQKVFTNVVNGVKYYKTAIVLQHDSKGYSVDAVERIINWGLANGYVFLPLTSSSPTAHHGVAN